MLQARAAAVLDGSAAEHMKRRSIRIGPAKLEGERTLRPAHASTTSAYPRDHTHELTRPRPLAQAVGTTCARSSVTSRLALRLGARRTREGVCSTARGPARSRGWLLASEPGSEDLPDRREQRRVCRCARPLACTCLRPLPGTSDAHSVCHTPQVAICALPTATDTAWVGLKQLSARLQVGRVCLRVVSGLRRSRARIVFRQHWSSRHVRGRVIGRRRHRLVLGSTVEPDTHLRRFGDPKTHIYHVV